MRSTHAIVCDCFVVSLPDQAASGATASRSVPRVTSAETSGADTSADAVPRGQAASGYQVPGHQPPSSLPSPGGRGPAYPVHWFQTGAVLPTMGRAQPRPRGSALPWVVVFLAAFLVCSMAGIAGLVGYADSVGALDTQASWRPGAGSSPGNLTPAQNASVSEWTDWARRSVDDALSEQATALLDADEEGYLAAVDPTNADLVALHKRRFRVLQEMGIGAWTEALTGGLTASGSRSWQGDIKISYCFGAATCTPVPLVVTSEWDVKDDRLVMVSLEESEAQWNGPRPWETDDLSVYTGNRVVIATTKINAWRLPEAVKAADRAALVADSLARWTPPPSRYLIFLAGPNDWKRWYGHSQPEWAAAWAVPVGRTTTEVVVRTQVVHQRGLELLLTHELTHVTTLAGNRDGATPSAWWLIEGLADYATMTNRPVREYDAIPPTRAFVRGRWDGDPAVTAPPATASLEEASGRYGVAFLTVRYIADKYGHDNMLDFFGRVVHDNQSADAAAQGALGQPWATVSAACAAFIRSSVG